MKIYYVAILVLLVLSSYGQCQTNVWQERQEIIDGYKTIYDLNSWIGQTKTNYLCLVTNWTPIFSALGITNGYTHWSERYTNGCGDSSYYFNPTNNTNVEIHLKVVEAQTVSNANEILVLGEFMPNPKWEDPLPRGDTNGVDVGDRCYVRQFSIPDIIWFCRNNVQVTLSSSPTGTYSVVGIASNLDQQILQKSLGE